jgi:hypothetical protein
MGIACENDYAAGQIPCRAFPYLWMGRTVKSDSPDYVPGMLPFDPQATGFIVGPLMYWWSIDGQIQPDSNRNPFTFTITTGEHHVCAAMEDIPTGTRGWQCHVLGSAQGAGGTGSSFPVTTGGAIAGALAIATLIWLAKGRRMPSGGGNTAATYGSDGSGVAT